MTDDLTTEELRLLLDQHRILWDEVKPTTEETNELVTYMVTDLYGDRTADIDGEIHRSGGRVDFLTELAQSNATAISTLTTTVSNGLKVRAEPPRWMVVVAVPVTIALLGLLGTIAAALL